MIVEIRRAEKAIGNVDYDLTPAAELNKNGRRSLYVSATIKKGEKFTNENIKSVRPGFGLSTKYKEIVLGREASKDLELGDRLSWEVIK